MHIKRVIYLSAAIAAIGLTGCAQNSGINEMVYNHNTVTGQKLKNSTLSRNITVANVTGGNETNPLWTSQINNANFKEALKRSLESANLYRDFASAKYSLDAKLIKLDQPLAGFDLTVNCQVHYIVKNVKNNNIIFNKNISSSYTAKWGDSFLAMTRLKMANEGAAKANIQKFIVDLYQLPKQS